MAVRNTRISCASTANLTCWRRSWERTPRSSRAAARELIGTVLRELIGTIRRELIGAAALCCLTSVAAAAGADLTCKSAADVATDLAAHRITAQTLITDYQARIGRLNPEVHAVIALNPHALAAARASDARRTAGRALGPLDGLPILVKDNIDIAGLPTTAGSLALAQNVRTASAPVVARLVHAGAVVLGRTNLSEWANIRSEHSSSGWSAVGGLTRNPYMLDRTACGSSSGSAAAVAAGMAAAAIGTETDGSISCPSSMNGLVGLKPTVGLVSRTGIVPISHTQDTAGPRRQQSAGRRDLSLRHGAHGRSPRPSGRAFLHGTEVVRGAAARPCI
jgi:amidase